jgi:hypothetical protein
MKWSLVRNTYYNVPGRIGTQSRPLSWQDEGFHSSKWLSKENNDRPNHTIRSPYAYASESKSC